MKPSNIMMGIGFTSLMIISMLLFIGGFVDSYPDAANINTTAMQRLDKMQDIEIKTEAIKASFLSGTTTNLDVFILAAQSVYAVIKLMFGSIIILVGMLLDIGSTLSVPSQITAGIITIITLGILIGIFRVLKGVGGGDI